MTDTDTLLIDPVRSMCLCDVGAPEYRAVVAVDAQGVEHLVLAKVDRINDDAARVDTGCAAAEHDQAGPLPLDVLRRVTIAVRAPRCGRRTQAGTPCRIQVGRPGQACGLHRTSTEGAEAS